MKKSILIMLTAAAAVSFAFIHPNPKTPVIVVIDAGHGGADFGVKHDEKIEKDLTAAIANKIKAMNTDSNVTIKFTRDGDKMMTLAERTNLINELHPDIVLSLHINADPNASKSGTELYVNADNSANFGSLALAEKLKSDLETKNGLTVGGIKQATFFILKNSKAAAITVDLGFLTNPQDAKYLSDDSNQEQLAKTILQFVSGL